MPEIEDERDSSCGELHHFYHHHHATCGCDKTCAVVTDWDAGSQD